MVSMWVNGASEPYRWIKILLAYIPMRATSCAVTWYINCLTTFKYIISLHKVIVVVVIIVIIIVVIFKC